MDTRQNIWRKKLMGNNITRKRHLFYTFVQTKNCNDVPHIIISTIKKDMPRTFPNQPSIQQNIQVIERLLTLYAAVQTGDSYIQGFNFTMAILLHVFTDTEHAEADTWWCFSGIISRIRPLMPDFNITWFDWCSRHWMVEFETLFKKPRPLLHSIIQRNSEQFSKLIVIKWFFLWFAQSISFSEIFNLWDFLIIIEPQHLMMTYVYITLEVLKEGAPTITYNYSESDLELIMAIVQMKIKGIPEIIRRVKRRLKT